MAKIGRVCKDYMIKELTDKLKDSPIIFVTDCTGLSVSELGKLRNKLKGAKASYMIVKNSLGKIALKNSSGEGLVPLIDGTIGLAFGSKDPIATSKILLAFAKEAGKLNVKGGVLDGKLINQADVKALSQLPSREVLLSRAFGAMKAPISGFVNVLNGTIRGFVSVVNEIKKKKEKETVNEGGVNKNG